MAENTGWEQTKAIWRKPENRFFYRMLGYAVLIGIGVLIGRVIYAAPDADQAWGYGVNLFTGILSTAATVLILDQLAERRADRKAEEALKRQLVMDAGSLSNEVAKNAVHQLRRKVWLEGEDGLLKGADLSAANLQGVDLTKANLRGTHLSFAKLQKADLLFAKLQSADLENAELQGAVLRFADLQGASLGEAKLQGVDLVDSNLQGASLFAYLTGNPAEFDETTWLPDGSHWTTETDMERFTNSRHHDFYRSDVSASPAYRGWD